MARIQKKEGFIRTPPNRYGPSFSLSFVLLETNGGGGGLHILFRFTPPKIKGGNFFTYSWSFLLTVKLLCLQFLKALIRRTFPL